MKFSKIFFGKPDVKTITEADLEEKIIGGLKQGSVESSSLELKSYAGINGIRDKINDITKNVVALANSSNRGGLIILGIDEERKKLTPIPLDHQKMQKDRIYQLIESRLLIDDPKSFEVHVIISQKHSDRGFIIIEVEVDEHCPYYWGYHIKKKFYPFVRKSEIGVENIPPSNIHHPQGYEVIVNYPREQIRDVVARNKAKDYPTILIPIEIKNIGIHPITNVEVKLHLYSSRITQKDRLLWIFKEETTKQILNKALTLNILIQAKGNPLNPSHKVKYLDISDGSLGNLIEMTFLEKFVLAQGQNFQVYIPILVNFNKQRNDKATLELYISSNELGQLKHEIRLNFVRYLTDG